MKYMQFIIPTIGIIYGISLCATHEQTYGYIVLLIVNVLINQIKVGK